MNKQEAKKLEKKVLVILKKYLNAKTTVVAGVSGGSDSIFLLHFLKQTSAKIIVAHLNHQLRKESKKEEEFVEKISLKNESSKIVFKKKKMNIAMLSKRSKQSIEETGRNARYKFFNQLAKKYQAKYLITAHHADDNLETIFHNFIRGASLQGLSGMQEVEDSKNSIKKLRPLLTISKNQILDYLHFKKISYQTDQSNFDTKYTRNFLRHEILPKLQQINPNLVTTISKNAEILKETDQYLKIQAQNWLKKNLEKTQLNAKSFRQQHPVLQKYILLQTHQNLIGNVINIENIHLNEVLELITKNIGQKKKKFGKLTITLKSTVIFFQA